MRVISYVAAVAKWVITALACALAACGSKSGLTVTTRDAGPDAARVGCLRDHECADGIECTLDRCERGRCISEPRREQCDDGIFCNGPERCVAGSGCERAPVVCDDGVGCTEDSCDPELDACTHTPDVGRCPVSYRCDATLDCVARALVHDRSSLFEVDLPSGEARFIAPTDVALTDIALQPDGRLLGVDHEALFDIDESSGTARWIVSLADQMVALDVGPDGALYGAGTTTVARISPATGAVEVVGRFPPGLTASGDIAFVGGRMYVSATRSPFSRSEPDSLVLVPLDGTRVVEIGSIGVSCVWGLAPFGDTLYGLTCAGQLLEIDVRTGAGRLLHAGLDIEVYGAAAR